MLELTTTDLNGQEIVLQFEHSLLSLSKWESRSKKAFYATAKKLPTEMIDYYGDMLLTPGVNPNIVYGLEPEQLETLGDYVNEQRTASSVPAQPPQPVKEVMTTELVYYWLASLEIPFHPVESWHFSRLMMLVQITSFKKSQAQGGKKQPNTQDIAKWREMSAKNRERFGSEG